MMNETQMTSLNFWMTGTVYFQLSPKLPVNTLGSVEELKVYSPGSAHTSTTLPCSTMSIH